MSEADRTILGIDLGVTSLAMAVLGEDGRTRVVPNADGDDATPAVLHVYDDDGVVIGSEAQKMLALDREHVVVDAPWHLGSATWSRELHGRSWSAQEFVGLLFRKLREDANELRGGDVRHAVLAVPSWYSSHQRSAAVEAARLGGLKALSLVNQPLAAALGLGAQTISGDGPVVVFDMGGRDLEVTTLLKEGPTLSMGHTEVSYELCVRAFEVAIRDYLVGRWREASGFAVQADEMIVQRVVDTARQALQALTHREEAPTRIAHGGHESRVTLDRATFGQRTAPLLADAMGMVERVLRESGHRTDQVVACLAVGSGSALPNVRAALQRTFGDRLRMPASPTHVIAQGAARLAALRHDPQHPGLTARPKRPKRNTLSGTPTPTIEREAPSATRATLGLADGGHAGTRPRGASAIRDALTKPLGLIALGPDRKERVIPLLPAGTPVPCEVAGRFTYAYDGMTGVRVEVTEGKGATRDEVTVVGQVELRGLPPRPVGTPLQVVYAYGEDQILRVHVVDTASGQRTEHAVRFSGGMDDDDFERAQTQSGRVRLD